MRVSLGPSVSRCFQPTENERKKASIDRSSDCISCIHLCDFYIYRFKAITRPMKIQRSFSQRRREEDLWRRSGRKTALLSCALTNSSLVISNGKSQWEVASRNFSDLIFIGLSLPLYSVWGGLEKWWG